MTSTIAPKTIKTADVKGAHDLVVAHYKAEVEDVPAGKDPAEHAVEMLSQELTALKFPRVDNLDAIIRSHNAAAKNGKTARYTPDTVSDTARLIAERICRTDFSATPEEAGCDNAADAGGDTGTPNPETGKAETGDAAAAHQADRTETGSVDPDTADAATPGTGNGAQTQPGFVIADGADALINPTISAATNQSVTSMAALLDAHTRVSRKVAEIKASIAAHESAIAAYESESGTVDESAAVKPEKFDPTGYADLDTGNPMVPVLDSLIHQHVSPETSFGEIVTSIRDGEDAIADGALRIKTLGARLRQARPKSRSRVVVETTRQTHVEKLSEIDALNETVEVVHETAADLFPNCYGGHSQNILQFDVPKLEFDGAHPGVPDPDSSFRFNTRVVVEALHSIAENEIIWLYGESGSGKSEFWAQIAAHLNMPFTRMNMDGHLTRSDIIGVNRLVPGEQGNTEMKFIEGILPRAMAQPGLLLIDEMDLGDPEIMPILQPILEGNPLVILEDGGRIIQPHPMFRIAITGNTIGLGSENQMYLNAFEQSAATRDRISAFVNMPYMPQDIEEQVVLARHPDADTDFINKLVKLANKVRDGYRNGDIQTLFSTRAVLYCARRHSRLAGLYATPDEAAHDILETVIMNRLDAGSTQTVKELIDQIFV